MPSHACDVESLGCEAPWVGCEAGLLGEASPLQFGEVALLGATLAWMAGRSAWFA
jgi:hypothetical protein